MKKPLLSTRVPFFGSLAMLVLCMVFFLVPFFARSARFAVDDVRNDVADWLPAHFIETQQLTEFREYFLGEQFVLVSWDGCNEDDPNFHSLVRMLRQESLAHSRPTEQDRINAEKAAATGGEEAKAELERIQSELKAKSLGDEYGWHFADSYHENIGSGHERWFKGRGGKWFYIAQDGKVYKWLGESDLLGGISRFVEQQWNGNYRVQGEHIATFGTPTNNEFYRDPRKLFARLFKDVQTGPDFLEQLAGKDGSLNITNTSAESTQRLNARIDAHQRLTGAFFGPTPSKNFDWTPAKMREELTPQRLKLMPDGWEEELGLFVQDVIKTYHEGKPESFAAATAEQRLEYWMRWWDWIKLESPPRQTAIMVTLNGAVIDDFSMVVGRGLLGKPRGRILELATGECGISPGNLHLGGPPVDNVSIDEEGSITLLRLAVLSGIIGIALSLLCFRSLRVTLMLFFVGGVAAISSLGIVWMLGGSLDAILMTMPSLVYVLAMSGSIHLVNYYRDACEESGRRFAVGEAVKHALFPCSVAAFTTAIGLLSLCTSSLAPINKFGFYSAIAVVGTVVLMFTYLPAALEVFPPNFARSPKDGKPSWVMQAIEGFWQRVGWFVTRYHWGVNVAMILGMIVVGYGITKVQTSVQLLKLFQPEAKILQDYRWFEGNLGKLVPMEILVRFQDRAVEPFTPRRPEPAKPPVSTPAIQPAAFVESGFDAEDEGQRLYQFTLRDRLELVRLLRKNLEAVFGPQGQDIIGSGMSIDVFTPQVNSSAFDMLLERDFDRLPRDFLYSPRMLPRPGQSADLGDHELWRISLRLGAFSDVDYGRFVNEIKQVVEPSMRACEFRNKLLGELRSNLQYGLDDEKPINILFISNNTADESDALRFDNTAEMESSHDKTLGTAANQAAVFAQTIRKLMQRKGIEVSSLPRPGSTYRQYWVSGAQLAERNISTDPTSFGKLLDRFSVVVVIDKHDQLDLAAIEQRPNMLFLDASSEFQYRIDPVTKAPLYGQQTAEQRFMAEANQASVSPTERVDVSAIYTGVIPIVYKAQRTLLSSLFESIFLSFVMIACVMAVLLRPWGAPTRFNNLVNFRGGMLSMLPNAFPIIMVFGMMGHLATYGVKVDIGSMMTASVAMGIAVDDTIHFLNWYRYALADGASRREAIMEAYKRCAKAMTQTTLIAGFGLFAFAFSSFTPTQRFGTLMLVLLTVALIGDLIFLPALLSSPWGKYFGRELSDEEKNDLARKRQLETRVSNPDDVMRNLDGGSVERENVNIGKVALESGGPHSKSSRGSLNINH